MHVHARTYSRRLARIVPRRIFPGFVTVQIVSYVWAVGISTGILSVGSGTILVAGLIPVVRFSAVTRAVVALIQIPVARFSTVTRAVVALVQVPVVRLSTVSRAVVTLVQVPVVRLVGVAPRTILVAIVHRTIVRTLLIVLARTRAVITIVTSAIRPAAIAFLLALCVFAARFGLCFRC